ncbi:hypothetical protein PoB_000294000 [Plakobranchus ocellatus]|uniref:Uncharacterized protein n=1 Tax=Plakobranchus ocellatus TaxID=259542 RepID=A0AAV3Y156_9GAST|nr:hypothetical protein PoB_000294000 [Plakobranchus ocellatus]
MIICLKVFEEKKKKCKRERYLFEIQQQRHRQQQYQPLRGNGINNIESQTAATSTAAYTSSNYTSSNIRISSSIDNGNNSTGGGNKLRGSIVWNHKQQQHLQLRAPIALAAAIIHAVISAAASAAAWTMELPALAVVPTVVLE